MTALLANGSLREWLDRLFGADTPLAALIFLTLIGLAFLAGIILVLAMIFRTEVGSIEATGIERR